MVHDDVIVIGGGLAGMTAALAAAREGAGVRVLTHKENTLRMASGLVDVLGYTPDGEGAITNPFEHVDDLPSSHPYTTVGIGTIREALSLFDEVAGETYRGEHTDRNALVPTFGGSVKPTARYPESVAAGLASDESDTLLVGFETLGDFDAPLAAANLREAGVPFDVRGVTIPFPGGFETDAKMTRYARALDADERLDGRPARDALADAVELHVEFESRVGFPAVLGDEHGPEVREHLESRLGTAVFEVPMGPPSLLGLRLEDAFETFLRKAGVATEAGNPVVDYEASDDRIGSVIVDRNGAELPYDADAFVLATGGLVGKGIETDRAGVREPIFDCHVEAPADRYEWSERGAFDDHAFARFGLDIDASLRPLDEAGEPEFGNLHAAGAVLGGYDFAAEKSGSGVSLATGLAAGRAAAIQ